MAASLPANPEPATDPDMVPLAIQVPDARMSHEGADLRQLMAILRRHWRSVSLCSAVATALGFAYLAITPKIYTATVSLLIDARTRTPLGSEQNINANPADAALIDSQMRLVTSDAILRRVVERERLADEQGYGAIAPGLLSRFIGFGTAADAAPEARSARALANLRRSINAKRSDRTYVMDIDVYAADGPTAARMSNAIAKAYMADQVDTKVQDARSEGEALNKRLADLQRTLSRAEARMQAYKTEHEIYDANGKRINEQELADGTTVLSIARTRTAEAKARLDQINRILAAGRSVETVPEALKSPAIDQLRKQYTDIARQEANYRTTLGDRHPALIETVSQAREIRKLIAEELKRIATGAANDYQAARDNEAGAERQVGLLKKSANATSEASVELRSLEHDVEASRSVYEKFLKARGAISEPGLDGVGARIITPAITPTAATSPKAMPILAIALTSGIFVGIAQAFFRQYLDEGAPTREQRNPSAPPTFAFRQDRSGRRRQEPEAGPIPDPSAQLPIFAEIPAAVYLAAQAPEPAPPAGPVEVSEAIHALWAELLLAAPMRRGKSAVTIMVTSTETGSGKTQVAIDLAMAAAATGERVLLLDGDSRNPELSTRLNLDPDARLINLMGTLRPCYRMSAGQGGNISVVPMISDERELVRQLQRVAKGEKIEGIAGNFNAVIIDGGTIGDDADSVTMADACDKIVLVTGEARLSRLQISRSLSMLKAIDSKFGGAVCRGFAARSAA